MLDATGHADNDGDGICDGVDCDNEVPADDGSGACGCVCHKENILMQLMYKILRFFWKIFGIGKSCNCTVLYGKNSSIFFCFIFFLTVTPGNREVSGNLWLAYVSSFSPAAVQVFQSGNR